MSPMRRLKKRILHLALFLVRREVHSREILELLSSSSPLPFFFWSCLRDRHDTLYQVDIEFGPLLRGVPSFLPSFGSPLTVSAKGQRMKIGGGGERALKQSSVRGYPLPQTSLPDSRPCRLTEHLARGGKEAMDCFAASQAGGAAAADRNGQQRKSNQPSRLSPLPSLHCKI